MKVKRKKWINFIKIMLFALIVLFMGKEFLRIFSYKDVGGGGGWQRFYESETNSIDVLFFGNSHAHCTIDHGVLWEEYGMAGYTISAGAQNIDSTYYFIKETLQTQKPKVILVEMVGATGGEIVNSETDVYRNLLGMKWSENFIEYLNYLSENMNMDHSWKQEIAWKMPILHDRYKEIGQEDFEDNIPFMRGYRGSFAIAPFDTPVVIENQTKELDPGKREMLQNIIDLARKENISLVLFASPFNLADDEKMQFNKVAEIAEENNVPFIDFNHLYNEVELDFQRDLRDESHLNNEGAAKVTSYLAEYLKLNYKIPDRRGEEGYELWEENALYLRNKDLGHELESAQDINEYLKIVSEMTNEQIVILALTGNYGALGDVYLDSLKGLGITEEEYKNGGVFVWKNGERIIYMQGKEYSKCIPIYSGEIHLDSSLYENEFQEQMEQQHLLINSKDYSIIDNGVNIIVYDERINQLIDAAGDDIYLGLSMIHYEKNIE